MIVRSALSTSAHAYNIAFARMHPYSLVHAQRRWYIESMDLISGNMFNYYLIITLLTCVWEIRSHPVLYEFSNEEKQALLDTHNYYRSDAVLRFGASDMCALVCRFNCYCPLKNSVNILAGVEWDLGKHGTLPCTGMLHDWRGKLNCPRVHIHRGEYGSIDHIYNRYWICQFYWTYRVLVLPVYLLQCHRQYLFKLMWSVLTGNLEQQFVLACMANHNKCISQVVWADTFAIGCGASICDEVYPHAIFLTCNYGPT